MGRNLLILVAVVVLAAVAAADDKKGGAGKLDGTWVGTSWKRGDREAAKDKVATELKIAGNAYEFPTGFNRISTKGALRVDAAKGTIDFTPADGPAKGKTLLGRYKIDGDQLTLCFSAAGKGRPKELKSEDRSTVLATYARKK